MFFQTIYGLLTDSTEVGINIRRVNDKLTVAVMPRHNELKERATDSFIPLVTSGTPEELDGGFADIMAAPVAKAVGIMTNLREFERQAEKAAAKAKPKAATEKVTKEAKETKEKNDRLDKLIKRVDESVTARRFADAIESRRKAACSLHSRHRLPNRQGRHHNNSLCRLPHLRRPPDSNTSKHGLSCLPLRNMSKPGQCSKVLYSLHHNSRFTHLRNKAPANTGIRKDTELTLTTDSTWTLSGKTLTRNTWTFRRNAA